MRAAILLNAHLTNRELVTSGTHVEPTIATVTVAVVQNDGNLLVFFVEFALANMVRLKSRYVKSDIVRWITFSVKQKCGLLYIDNMS